MVYQVYTPTNMNEYFESISVTMFLEWFNLDIDSLIRVTIPWGINLL